jgi:DNA-binding phage protein
MDTLTSLINRLQVANLVEVAREADVSRKTLDRIRSRENSPTLATVSKINSALDKLRIPKKPKGVNPSARAPEERAESATAGAGQE